MPDNQNMETLIKGITTVQETVDKFAGRLDALEKEKVEKASNAAANALEQLNKANDRIKALEDEQKNIELMAARSENGEVKESKEYQKALGMYFRKGVAVSEDLVKPVVQKLASVVDVDGLRTDMVEKDLVSAIGPQGGYWVQPERSNQMTTRIFESSPMMQLANRMTTTSDTVEIIVDDDDVTANWVTEVGSRAATTTPDINMVSISVHELHAAPKATQKMLDDAGFDIAGWLQNKVSSKFGRTSATSFISGSGAGAPKGILSYAAWASAGVYEFNKIEQLATGSSGSFDADNFIELQNALLEDYQPGATWLMKRATFTEVAKLKEATTGAYLLNPRIIAEGADKILLGSPIRFAADMPAIAADALAVAYGDFMEGYTIVNRHGIRILRDPYTATPFTIFHSYMRVGGAVTNFQAIKIMKLSA